MAMKSAQPFPTSGDRLTSYDSGYEHSLEHLLQLRQMIAHEKAETEDDGLSSNNAMRFYTVEERRAQRRSA